MIKHIKSGVNTDKTIIKIELTRNFYFYKKLLMLFNHRWAMHLPLPSPFNECLWNYVYFLIYADWDLLSDSCCTYPNPISTNTTPSSALPCTPSQPILFLAFKKRWCWGWSQAQNWGVKLHLNITGILVY